MEIEDRQQNKSTKVSVASQQSYVSLMNDGLDPSNIDSGFITSKSMTELSNSLFNPPL